MPATRPAASSLSTTTRCWPSSARGAPTAVRLSPGPDTRSRRSSSKVRAPTCRSTPSCWPIRTSFPARTIRGWWLGCVRRREPQRAVRAVPAEGEHVSDEVVAEMVANVWKVVVAMGDRVDDGDTLVILESMKMEIPVVTESAGTVAELRVVEGDVVQEGDVIAVIE